ncbi:MAG: hypothetical protein K8R87_01145 [Verrucomicrobia bacterium]|nr:hypothetical protein [Verrucomicrobiota bacterium]
MNLYRLTAVACMVALACALVLCHGMAGGEAPAKMAPVITHTYAAEVVSVHDGDTIKITVDFEHKVSLHAMPVRLADVFALELSTAGGKLAQANLARMLPTGTPIIVQFTGAETFCRPVCNIWLAKEGTHINSAQQAWLMQSGNNGGTGSK